MKINRAIAHMEHGRYCRRKAWGENGGRVYISDVDLSLRWADGDPTENAICSLNAADIKADDWVVIR